MASLTLSRAKQNMADANVPMATLALVCGLRPTSLSSAFRGVMNLPSTTEARLFSASCRVLEITQALSPLLPPNDANELGRLLVQLEDGHISLEDIRAAVKRLFGQ
jgi:hypothetical protein